MGKHDTAVCDNCGETFKGSRKFCTARCKKDLEVKAKGTTKFLRGPLATLFQKMIRAEWGALPPGYSRVVKDSAIVSVHRHLGQCVCITCGRVELWSSGLGGMHTGHFIASRRTSILLEEANVAPQCSFCNRYSSGQASRFRMWMESVRGVAEIERLERLKTVSVSLSRDELVDLWFDFDSRLKAAVRKMKG